MPSDGTTPLDVDVVAAAVATTWLIEDLDRNVASDLLRQLAAHYRKAESRGDVEVAEANEFAMPVGIVYPTTDLTTDAVAAELERLAATFEEYTDAPTRELEHRLLQVHQEG